MTQATKTLFVLFILSLILVVTIELTTRTTTSELMGSEIVSFQPEQINRITIRSNDIGDVTLVRRDSAWTVTNSETDQFFETEPNAVESAINSVENLTVRSLLTRNPGQHIRYEVDDSTGTVVELYDDDTLAGGLILGGINFVGQSEYNTYLRAAGADEVYAVSGFLTSRFNKDIDAWRDKTVWDIPQNDIQQISFDYPADSSFTIVRGTGESVWLTAEGDSVQSDISNRLISNLSRLRAQGFTRETVTELPGIPLYRITLDLGSGQQRNLSITEGPEENQYIAEAGEYPFLFTLDTSFRNAVLLSREEIIAIPDQ